MRIEARCAAGVGAMALPVHMLPALGARALRGAAAAENDLDAVRTEPLGTVALHAKA